MDQIANTRIHEIYKANQEMIETPVRSENFPELVEKFKGAVLGGASLHRNWNQKTESIDGMIEYMEDDDIPEGAGECLNVTHEDYTPYEGAIEELLYLTETLSADTVNLSRAYNYVSLQDRVMELTVLSPDWDMYRGLLQN